MGTVQTNYFVTNEYLLKDKPYLHEAIDLVTLPIRALLDGRMVNLKGNSATVGLNVFDFSKTISSPSLASLVSRVLRFATFVLFAYFYRVSLTSCGLLFAKYLIESHYVEQQIQSIAQRSERAQPLEGIRAITLDTTALEMPENLHPHKRAIYDKFKGKKRWIEDTIRLTIYPLDREKVKNLLIFSKKCGGIVAHKGYFSYPESKELQEEWTANFSTSKLFSNCLGGDLTQDDLQVMEHPGLYHIKNKIDEKPELGTLKEDEIALITGAKRYGMFLANRCSRQDFAREPLETVRSYAFKKLDEAESRIFCIPPPEVQPDQQGKPYTKEDLETLFYRSYHAFSKIKALAAPQKVRIHTGNWGCGVSGNNLHVVALMQIAAAHLAGVDYLEYYPMGAGEDWRVAKLYYNSLATQKYSDWTVDKFLSEIANRAEELGFVYRLNRD